MTQFDPLVVRAMARWPDVPAVYGWLRLDRRGGWHLIDRGRPGFDPVRDAAGSPITSTPILDFIARNYAGDESGRWFWQNGPQRVYVTLDSAPLILRVLGTGAQVRLITHTGLEFGRITRAALGPEGEILLASDLGCGAIHDLDTAALSLEQSRDGVVTLAVAGDDWQLQPCDSPEKVFGYMRRPA
jgi:hypothetical protein